MSQQGPLIYTHERHEELVDYFTETITKELARWKFECTGKLRSHRWFKLPGNPSDFDVTCWAPRTTQRPEGIVRLYGTERRAELVVWAQSKESGPVFMVLFSDWDDEVVEMEHCIDTWEDAPKLMRLAVDRFAELVI